MGVDDALAESVRAGGPPVVRLYRWSPACLSLGRNQPARGRYDLERIRASGWDVVRRPTGGRAVLHHRELTYSVAVPDAALGGPRAGYAAINRGLVAGLRRLGVPAALQGRTGRRAPAPSLAPCFAGPAEGEVIAAGRKLVGSAQRRERGVLLQHGSLLLDGDQRAIAELRSGPAHEAPGEAPATLSDFCAPLPCWEALVRALAAGWEEVLGVRLAPDALRADEEWRAGDAAARYRDPAWTWRS